MQIHFLRELRFWEPYNVEVKISGFDAKWVFLHMAFVSTRTGQLHAVGLSRFVAKYPSRKTVPPAALFSVLGYSVPPLLAERTTCEKLNAGLEEELREGARHHLPPPPPAVTADRLKSR